MKKFALAVVFLALAVPSAFATPAVGIIVTWNADSTSVTVTSDKELSNVVLEDCPGVRYKYDSLSGNTGTFSHPSGLAITAVWVKSGDNDSGDGPGYGQKFTNPDENICGAAVTTSTATTVPATTATTEAATTTTTSPATTTTTVGVGSRQLGPDVLGIRESLPRTGATLFPLFIIGLVVLVSGQILRRLSTPSSGETADQ